MGLEGNGRKKVTGEKNGKFTDEKRNNLLSG